MPSHRKSLRESILIGNHNSYYCKALGSNENTKIYGSPDIVPCVVFKGEFFSSEENTMNYYQHHIALGASKSLIFSQPIEFFLLFWGSDEDLGMGLKFHF